MSRVTDPHTYTRRRVLATGLALSAVGGLRRCVMANDSQRVQVRYRVIHLKHPAYRATTRVRPQSLVQANHNALRPSTPPRITTTLMNSAGTRQTPFVDQQISHSRHGQ